MSLQNFNDNPCTTLQGTAGNLILIQLLILYFVFHIALHFNGCSACDHIAFHIVSVNFVDLKANLRVVPELIMKACGTLTLKARTKWRSVYCFALA